MKVKLITTATDVNNPGFQQLKRSLDRFGWGYDVIKGQYYGYGSKMVRAYEYAKKTDCTHLFIVDAYDIVMLGTMEEALSKIKEKDCILFNAEKGCWPYGEWADRYPVVNSDWKYLNGGAAFVNVEQFIEMFESQPIKETDNDQVNLAEMFLSKRFNFKLDNNCECFQSIAFESKDDFFYGEDGRLQNLKTGAKPVVIHGNGRTDMSLIYDLLK